MEKAPGRCNRRRRAATPSSPVHCRRSSAAETASAWNRAAAAAPGTLPAPPPSLQLLQRLPFSAMLFFLLLLLPFANCLLVSADDIFAQTPGVMFGQGSREPKYKIEFHSTDSSYNPDSSQESVVISTKQDQSYVCFLPLIEESKYIKSASQHNSSNIILDTERKIKQKTPDELLDLLKDKCFYRHEGWWSYEFCYQKHVSQLHLEDDKIVQEFYLGQFDAEATAPFNQNDSDMPSQKDPRSKDASQRYHAHLYTNGTACDITGEPRETEVRFVCSESAVVISSIKELSTCKYAVTVQCPMLCKHPMFQQEKPMWHTIHCNELPAEATAAVRDEPTDTEDGFMDALIETSSGDVMGRYLESDPGVQPS